jgi:molecular chaperone DnaJ
MDFYALLGIARAATTQEIDRAYRRLARRFHPGVNPGDERAAAVYEQLQEAYEILVDVERRREYDSGRHRPVQPEGTLEFGGFDFSRLAEGPRAATFAELFADVFQAAAREATTPSRGSDIDLAVTLSFEQAIHGSSVPLSVTHQERCPMCQGNGRVPRRALACPRCDGTGSRRWVRGHMVFTKACEACDGHGQITADPCRGCAGIGLAARTDVVTVTIPGGLESGARIAVPGRGHAGARGGPAGDLYVTVSVVEHPHFRRVGRDIHFRLPLAIHEAAFGATVDVPTLEGFARLRVPPGTSAGQRLRLRGRGVPSGSGREPAGDLVAEVELVIPSTLDARSRELLREFGERNRDSVRSYTPSGVS